MNIRCKGIEDEEELTSNLLNPQNWSALSKQSVGLLSPDFVFFISQDNGTKAMVSIKNLSACLPSCYQYNSD
jgi:hypothetical protein